MKELTRRQFLQGLAAGAAGIGIASVFPGLVPAADAASEPAAETTPVPAADGTLTVLGARGSAPICRQDSLSFGGSTTCFMLRACGETIFLDAGTGLFSAPNEYPNPPVFLVSHLHIDHLLGLGMYPRLSQKGAETTIYLPTKDGDAVGALDGLYSPPYWPLSLTALGGDVRVLPQAFPLQIGEINVDSMEGCHPGGVQCFRIRCKGKTLVYATDFEHEEPYFSDLIDFSKDADLVLYDAQYTQEEYEKRKGFGHSTAEKGLELLDRSGAAQLLLIHHDPNHADEQLLEMEAQIGRENVRYARAGDVIPLF